MTARLLLIDNYDSFTYNLVQAFLVLGADVRVYRNDAITVDEIERSLPDRLVISPGPGRPESAGVTLPLMTAFDGIEIEPARLSKWASDVMARTSISSHASIPLVIERGDDAFELQPLGLFHLRVGLLERVAESLPYNLRLPELIESVDPGGRHLRRV